MRLCAFRVGKAIDLYGVLARIWFLQPNAFRGDIVKLGPPLQPQQIRRAGDIETHYHMETAKPTHLQPGG